MMQDDELVQYYVVNKELGMSPPKIWGQIAHVATIMARKYSGEPDFEAWFNGKSQTKILLEGKTKDLQKLIEAGFDFIIDEGRTEIPKDSLTVVGLKPTLKSMARPYTKRLRLYKWETPEEKKES